jgi:hypothetical protein
MGIDSPFGLLARITVALSLAMRTSAISLGDLLVAVRSPTDRTDKGTFGIRGHMTAWNWAVFGSFFRISRSNDGHDFLDFWPP